MSLIDTVRRQLPVKYRELAKFLVVGGTTYVVDVGLFSLLSHTVLANKVVTAKAISVLVATILSYVLNREWSFSRRGGREKHHEAMLFFVVNGIALALNLVPLALSQYVFGFNTSNYAQLTVTVANFISANIIGTILGMAFRFWAYRKWVFPEELTPHPELVAEAEAIAAAAAIAAAEAAAASPVDGQAPLDPFPVHLDPVHLDPVHLDPVHLENGHLENGHRDGPSGTPDVAELPANRRSA
ncbi:MAG TPA: GtrA family protein [Nakamurella sp.]